MGAALVMLALLGLVALPGLLLHRALLAERGFSPLVAVTLALALLAVLFSDVAALFGYRLWLMLALNAGLLLAGVGLWLARREEPGAWREWLASLRPSGPDALYFGVIFAIFAVPGWVLVVPFDTDAQGFGYLALTVKLGGTVDTLAPFFPDVHYLYSPSFFVLTAYLSDLLGLPLHEVMLGLGHAAAGLVALLSYDLGRTLDSRRVGLLMAFTVTAGLGLLTTVMDSAYTSVMALLFVELFLILLWRAMESQRALDVTLAALALAAVPLTHPDTTVILLIAYLPFYVTAWLSHEMNWSHLRLMGLLVPALGVLLTLPWLARVFPLFFDANIHSPFEVSVRLWPQLVVFNGLLVPLLALWGAVLAVRRRRLCDVIMLTWLLSVIDFGLFGFIGQAANLLGLDIMRYVYPFSVAWHGPVIPFAYLASVALDDLAGRVERLGAINWQRVRAIGALVGLLLLAGALVASKPLVRLSKGWVNIYGGFTSRADVAALRWLEANSPPDSLLMNYPVFVEGHWAPVISERNVVTFRDQHFFSQRLPILEKQLRLENEVTQVYHDLATPESEAWLRGHGVDYVFVPQVITNPDSLPDLQRWTPPFTFPFLSTPAEADYLQLVYERDGAQVYRTAWAGEG